MFNKTDINDLRNNAIRGDLRTSRFRSICWRLLLEILPPDSSEWSNIIEKYRFTYEQIKLKHYNDPHTQDSGPDNPLSQDDDVCLFSIAICMKKFILFCLFVLFSRVCGNNILKTLS